MIHLHQSISTLLQRSLYYLSVLVQLRIVCWTLLDLSPSTEPLLPKRPSLPTEPLIWILQLFHLARKLLTSDFSRIDCSDVFGRPNVPITRWLPDRTTVTFCRPTASPDRSSQPTYVVISATTPWLSQAMMIKSVLLRPRSLTASPLT